VNPLVHLQARHLQQKQVRYVRSRSFNSCVPATVEYSNREFYEGDIKPLRLPHATERLDPPLIDVFVKGGYLGRDGSHQNNWLGTQDSGPW
jgi:hypothetical protein